MDPAALDPQSLLARAGWLRSLAASLVADPSTADDVAQDTLVAALKRPPAADRPVEPWLARVAKNFARRERRTAVRRAAREEFQAREPSVAPLPAEVAERLELSRHLIDAVAHLEEPLRTTIVLRYFEERTSVEIARIQRVPDGTVRWRIQRALDRLRERLDARFGGDRAAWSALLLPLAQRHAELTAAAGASAAAAAGATTPGVLVMSAMVKIGAAAAVVAVAGVLWWSWREPAETVAVAGAGPVELATPPSETSVPALAAPEATQEAQRIVSPEAPAEPAEPKTPPPAAALTATALPAIVEARFVDPQGTPWMGVRLARREGKSLEPSMSGPDGRARLEIAPPWEGAESWRTTLYASRPGCATVELASQLRPGETNHLGEIVLGPGVAIAGRVVGPGGQAIEGATVGLSAKEFEQENALDGNDEQRHRHGSDVFAGEPSTASLRDGSFVLDGIGPGTWRLWAKADGHRFGWTEPFEVLLEHEAPPQEIVLAPFTNDDYIAGQVVDPQGNPVPNAKLMHSFAVEHMSMSSTVDVGDDGRFQILVHWSVPYSLVASDPEGRFAEAALDQVQPGTKDIVLRLGEARAIELTVRDPDGGLVEDCSFMATRTGTYHAHTLEKPSLAPGRYRLPLAGEQPISFALKAQGFLTRALGPFDPATAPATLEIVLERAPVVQGRVTALGKPIAGALVELCRDVSPLHYEYNGFRCVMDPSEFASATTDADGRFQAGCDSREPFWIVARADGFAASDLGPIESDAIDTRGYELELTTGGAIEGRVIGADGRPAEGAIVGLNHGDGRPRTTRAGPGGTYRVEGLSPGKWEVTLRAEEMRTDSITTMSSDQPTDPIEWTCEVVAGQTTRQNLAVPVK